MNEATMEFNGKHIRLERMTMDILKHIYPGVEVERELMKMELWLEANPRRQKKNYQRFMVGWLNKVHAQLLAAEVTALAKREQERVDAEVGKARGPIFGRKK